MTMAQFTKINVLYCPYVKKQMPSFRVHCHINGKIATYLQYSTYVNLLFPGPNPADSRQSCWIFRANDPNPVFSDLLWLADFLPSLPTFQKQCKLT